jgi:hypothetical protein
MSDPKRYLAVIQLRSDSNIERLTRDVPLILDWLTHFSKGEHEQAFRSNDRLLFGYFLRTSAPQFLQAEFEKCRGTINGDALLVFEAGELVAGVGGFSRAWAWLQRH